MNKIITAIIVGLFFVVSTAKTADLSPTAASVNTVSGTITSGTFAYAATRGDLVVSGPSGWTQADADVDSGGKTMGIVVTPPIASGQLGVVQVSGTVDIAATLTGGVVYVASTAAAKIAPVTDLGNGDFIHIVGFSEEDDVSNNNIDLILKTTSISIGT